MTEQPSSSSSPSNHSPTKLQFPRQVGIGNALQWVNRGTELFRLAPGPWAMTMVLWFVIILLSRLVPVVGLVMDAFLSQVFVAGLFLGCHAQHLGAKFNQNFLFAGFSRQLRSLVFLSILVMVIDLLASLFVFSDVYWELLIPRSEPSAEAQSLLNDQTQLVSLMMQVLLILMPVKILLMFAPGLIIVHGLSVTQAVQLSAIACLRNVPTLLFYALILMSLGVLVVFTFGIALLAILPIYLASIYAAYRDIFIYSPTSEGTIEA
ncbi:BPSS1780 family membrane protein [Pleionea litopenaei]|uniref:BPSS1780 family membrane protein n=1 Tax=Pleionea litopenaei TaxID=3070815 RepID=A0AA51RWN6_9GAMM|nr:BPSS1780 family membrane protein [Pleionea sp. HL-JVS1]WMS89151.1 BPSS1780 family membrane protein [Pleionea sp. HL-JVS1]